MKHMTLLSFIVVNVLAIWAISKLTDEKFADGAERRLTKTVGAVTLLLLILVVDAIGVLTWFLK